MKNFMEKISIKRDASKDALALGGANSLAGHGKHTSNNTCMPTFNGDPIAFIHWEWQSTK